MGFHLIFKVWKFNQFRDLFFAGFINSIARWFEVLSFSIIAWNFTKDASIVGLLITFRLFSLALTGLFFSFTGTMFSGRSVMIFFTFLCSLSFLITSILIILNIDIILYGLFILSSLSGALWSVDFSFRRRMLADTLPKNLLSTGVSIDVLSSHATRLIGPLMGGITLSILKYEFILLLLCIFYLLSLLFLLPHKDKFHLKNENSISLSFKEVINESIQNRNLLIVIILTPIFNIFALPFLALIGILLIEKFQNNTLEIGFYTSIEGFGALLGGLIISAFPPNKKSLFFCIMLFILLLSIILSSISNHIILFLIFIFSFGFSTACYSALQSTIIYLHSSTKLRSSTFSLLTIGIGSGAVGSMNISWMSGFLNTQNLSFIMGLEGLILFCIINLLLYYKNDRA
tara:strand:+ start:187 stop:1392 length:1206 start_codon:yes stop_codon:yes gene_type:complete